MPWASSVRYICLLFIAVSCFPDLDAANSTANLKKEKESDSMRSEPQQQTSSKETSPKFTYAVWDENGKICILAKFEAAFQITYETSNGKQYLNIKIPRNTTVKGRCMDEWDEKPYLVISWKGGFTLRTTFGKHAETKSWGIDVMDFMYNTQDAAFSESVNGRKIRVRSDSDSLTQFETSLGNSYFCSSPSIINMYTGEERTVIVRMSSVQLQAYGVTKGKFSPMSRCGLVGFGSGVIAPFYMTYHEDDSASMVVGTITIFVSLATVAGYGVYRSWFIKKVDYDTMI